MEGLKGFPDKFWDLACVDVPYGNECKIVGGSALTGKNGWSGMIKKAQDWNTEPSVDYFKELLRVSKNQIIWGANHFIDLIRYRFSCFIIWDKGQRDFSLADCEMAWTSFDSSARVFDYSRAKALQDGKIHPTQKPIALYKWILKNYAKPRDKILDTHLGSGSSRIAAYDMGFDFWAWEKDTDYHTAQEKRFNEFKSQLKMF